MEIQWFITVKVFPTSTLDLTKKHGARLQCIGSLSPAIKMVVSCIKCLQEQYSPILLLTSWPSQSVQLLNRKLCLELFLLQLQCQNLLLIPGRVHTLRPELLKWHATFMTIKHLLQEGASGNWRWIQQIWFPIVLWSGMLQSINAQRINCLPNVNLSLTAWMLLAHNANHKYENT